MFIRIKNLRRISFRIARMLSLTQQGIEPLIILITISREIQIHMRILEEV